MALSDIINKIDRDAEEEAGRIAKETEEKTKVILNDARAHAKEIMLSGRNDAERAAAKASGRMIASATHDAKFAVQSLRTSLIERVLSETSALLSNLKKEDYRTLITSRAKAISGMSGTLTLSGARAEETRAILKDLGVKADEVRVLKTDELRGGFIFETPTAVYDHSFASLMEDAKDRYSKDIARMLFAS